MIGTQIYRSTLTISPKKRYLQCLAAVLVVLSAALVVEERIGLRAGLPDVGSGTREGRRPGIDNHSSASIFIGKFEKPVTIQIRTKLENFSFEPLLLMAISRKSV